MAREGVEVVIRSVVKNGEDLQRMVALLTNLYGPGSEIDSFEEQLVFHPKQEQGNMNYINRDVHVRIEYRADSVVVKHIGSPATGIKGLVPGTQASTVTETIVEACNIRRVFTKTGFVVASDFAKKGLEFKTRHGATVVLSRPYNAALAEDKMYVDGRASWEPLGGPLPFGSDYLLELKQLAEGQGSVDSVVHALNELSKELTD